MANPNLDRKFNFESIQEYYLAKLQGHTKTPKFNLISNSFPNIDALATNIQEKIKKIKIKGTSWEAIQRVPSQSIWELREYIFASSMLFVGMHVKDFSRTVPSDFAISKNTFTVIGSQKLSSDIDVTVQGPYTYILIMLIEDLFETFTKKYKIPMNYMDIEFYGDFRILKKLYINTHNFSEDALFKLLRYAYVSYFRSRHIYSIKDVSSLAIKIGEQYLDLLNNTTPIHKVLQAAQDQWNKTAPGGKLNREIFYKLQQQVEEDSSHLLKTKGKFKDLANEMFFLRADADIHRPESYVLPTTATHIVEIEQVKGDHAPKIDYKWFTENAKISLNKYAYIASAIEQLGYLEYYHPASSHDLCNKKGVKYFGRMIRALQHAKLLNKTFTPLYEIFNAYRRTTGDGPCPSDIHTELEKVKKELQFPLKRSKTLRKNRYSERFSRKR